MSGGYSSVGQGLSRQPLSIAHLLEHQAQRSPDALAILAPGRASLTYGRLQRHIDEIVQTLHAMGVGLHDRVALVLPNGPEMAVAFLAVAAGATCAPLNPAYGANELDRYLTDLQAHALMIQRGIDSPARDVALTRGLRIIELWPTIDAEAGLFTLTGETHGSAAPHRIAQPDNVALTLLTSGTTSRPKIVPLTHTNICASAYHSRVALALAESDRCLNVLPLIHGHGLIATMLASLGAGASIVCTPGFDASTFFAWLAEFRPTWYSAVPTMHQAILSQATGNGASLAGCPLRFVRSASAPLPPRVLTELERVFNAPVIEFYGMTETASTPIACNPFPPREGKAGSVGIRVGLEVAIMDEGGALLPEGETGEVVVRGASVMQGYDGDPMANRDAFSHGWFRTGDQGVFDADGHLFLTGRFKEIINRGGEKIAPQEVDDVLMEHPAVAQAVTFAMPHTRLGEDIAAAVVLRPKAAVTATEIRQFAARRLANFKVPRQVLIVEDLPTGPTGKLQRIGLAAKLGLAMPDQARPAPSEGFVAPRMPFEEVLAGIWAQVLAVECVGIHDDFFALGGDSLLATQLLSRIRDATHAEVSFARFFETPTVAGLASSLETAVKAKQGQQTSAIVPVPRERALPASIAQEQIWVVDQVFQGLPLFNILYAMRLQGICHVAILQQSCDEIIRRHEALRTTLAAVEGRLVQVIAPTLSVPVTVVELCALTTPERESEAQRLADAEARQPFDLEQGPLLRLRLLRMDEQQHLLLVTMHHIIADGWSLGVLAHELAVLYDAFSTSEPSPLPELRIQYADFAHWQRQWRDNVVMAAQLAYWQEQLRNPLPALELPTDHPRGNALSLRTARQSLVLPGKLSESLRGLSHRDGGTLFMTLVAAFKMLLYGYTGQEDLRVATLIANRNRRETEEVIGLFVNMVILRTDLRGDPTYREVLQRVRATTLAAYAHQDLPFEDLVQTLERERGLKPPSLCQVMFILQNATLRPLQRSTRTLNIQEADLSMMVPPLVATTFDVILILCESPQELTSSCIYKAALFDAATINRMLRDFQHVLECLIGQPEQPLSTFRSLGGDRSRGA
jgi:acyl-CoA synthetase (AMP-forming)/AMP-acid ligase II/aryl carrier-like protein